MKKNRLHKMLDNCGIHVGCVVSDIDGVSGRAMVEALIEGGYTPHRFTVGSVQLMVNAGTKALRRCP